MIEVYCIYVTENYLQKGKVHVSYFSGRNADNNCDDKSAVHRDPAAHSAGSNLPENDQGGGQYGRHIQRSAEAVQAEICQLLSVK